MTEVNQLRLLKVRVGRLEAQVKEIEETFVLKDFTIAFLRRELRETKDFLRYGADGRPVDEQEKGDVE